MGTSNRYGGPRDALLPSWLDKPTPVPQAPTQPLNPPAEELLPQSSDPVVRPKPPSDFLVPRPNQSLTSPRINFTRYARSGDRRQLNSGLSGYVRAVGGSKGAARRMGSSRGTTSALIGVARTFLNLGPRDFLAAFSLQALTGRPADEVLAQLVDQLCPPGGTVDEAIARTSMLAAIDVLAEADVGAIEQLSADHLEILIAEFISKSIELRIFNDIGGRGITLPANVDAVDEIQAQLHDAVSGCVRRAMVGRLRRLDELSNEEIARRSDQIYETAFGLIGALVGGE